MHIIIVSPQDRSVPKIGLFECRIAVLAVQENACQLAIPIYGIIGLNIERGSLYT